MTVKMCGVFFFFFAFWLFFLLYFLPVLEAESILRQINEKTVNYKAVIKCFALPFVTPANEAVYEGHHGWRCDMFTARCL